MRTKISQSRPRGRRDDCSAMNGRIDMDQEFVRGVRHRLGMTQVELARSIDVSLDTLRNWEQGRRGPSGAAKTLFRVLDAEPDRVLRVIGHARTSATMMSQEEAQMETIAIAHRHLSGEETIGRVRASP